MLADSDV